MKRVAGLLIVILFTYSTVFGQEVDTKLSINDYSRVIPNYKVFTTHSSKMSQVSESEYDVDYLLGLFYVSYISKDSVFVMTSRAEDIISGKSGRNRYLKHGRKVLQGFIVDGSRRDSIRFLGRNMLNSEKIISYFTVYNPKFAGYVYQTISVDNGVSWQPPTIAIKHNKIKLFGWEVVEPKTRQHRYGLSTILTDINHQIYLSHSSDNGNSWTYPSVVFKQIKGIGFNASMYHGNVFVVFKLMENYLGFEKGDVLVWYGKKKNFTRDWSAGRLIRVATASKSNESWAINHTSSKDIFLIKTTSTSSGNEISGYILPMKVL